MGQRRVLRYVIAILGASGIIFWPAYLDAATRDDVIRAWEQRERDVVSFRFLGNIEQVVMKKAQTPFDQPKTRLPLEDTLLRRECSYSLKEGKAIFVEKGQVWESTSGVVVNRELSMNFDRGRGIHLFTDANDPIPHHGVVFLADDQASISRQTDIMALTLIYRPLSHFLAVSHATAKVLSIRDSQSTPTPAGHVSVALTPPDQSVLVYYVWTDPTRSYLPVRWLREQSGQLVQDASIEYRKEGLHDVPAKWRFHNFRRGELFGFSETTFREAQLNPDLDDDHFTIDFPRGTWVNEYENWEDTGETSYVILANGTKRYLSTEERKEGDVENYEKLMRTQSWSGLYLWVSVVVAAVIAAVVVVVYRRRSA